MDNFLEAFFRGTIGGLFTYIVFLFFGKIIKTYKNNLPALEKEKLSLKEEQKDLLHNKEKIIEDRTIKKMKELNINPDSNYQEYYSIREEQEEIIKNRIEEIDNQLSNLSKLNS